MSTALVACSDLSGAPLEVCGNGIVEPAADEDCDGAEGCIAADEPGACLWSCGEGDCPDGLGCGTDGACRRPSDSFESAVFMEAQPFQWVDAADLDGDGRDELLALEAELGAPSVLQGGTLHFVHFADDRGIESQWSWGNAQSLPNLRDLDGDGAIDLSLFGEVFTEPGQPGESEALAMWRNRGDGTFSPMLVNNLVRSRPAPVDGIGELPGPNRGLYITYQNQVWLVNTDADRPVLGQPLPAARWPDAVALHPHYDLGSPCSGPGAQSQFDYAMVEGDETHENRFAGPVRTWAVCEETARNARSELTLPPDSVAFAPWVRLVQLDGPSTPLDVATVVVHDYDFEVSRCGIHVAYGMTDGSVHSSPDLDPPENGDDQLPSEALIEFDCGPEVAGTQLTDLDHDGTLDVVGPGFVALSKACVTACDCGAHECIELGAGFDEPLPLSINDVDVADIDGNGWRDIVLGASVVDFEAQSGGLVIYRNIDGTLVGPEFHGVAAPVLDVSAIDFAGDGDPEIAFSVDEDGDLQQDGIYVATYESGVLEIERVVVGLPLEGGLLRSVGPIGRSDGLVTVAPAGPGESGFLVLGGPPDQIGSAVVPRTLGDQSSWHFSWARPAENEREIRIVTAGTNAPTVSDLGAAIQIRRLTWDAPEPCTQGDTCTERSIILRGVGQQVEGSLGTDSEWTRDMNWLDADLDSDGADELVMFGAPNEDGMGYAPGGVIELDFEGITTELRDHDEVARVDLGGRIPYAPSNNPIEAADLDGDGDEDVIATGCVDYEQGPCGPLALFNEAGVLADARLLPDAALAERLVGWSFVGLPHDRSARVLACEGDSDSYELLVGGYDLDDGFEIRARQPHGHAEPRFVATGDFDGDGLPDVAMATLDGIVIYWGTPAHGEGD